ncbi:hypothetical protein T492DRAFT_878939 [Pavlovales sp. CCMP2436]|nr:hypothetical protein T492DRAFT_878939 [Pavlovales sp. CCMP2436]
MCAELESHTSRPNYDDANEFFWSASCLEYCYHDAPEAESPFASIAIGLSDAKSPADPVGTFKKAKSEDRIYGSGAIPGAPPIGDAPIPKTYIERRSWLHPIK